MECESSAWTAQSLARPSHSATRLADAWSKCGTTGSVTPNATTSTAVTTTAPRSRSVSAIPRAFPPRGASLAHAAASAVDKCLDEQDLTGIGFTGPPSSTLVPINFQLDLARVSGRVFEYIARISYQPESRGRPNLLPQTRRPTHPPCLHSRERNRPCRPGWRFARKSTVRRSQRPADHAAFGPCVTPMYVRRPAEMVLQQGVNFVLQWQDSRLKLSPCKAVLSGLLSISREEANSDLQRNVKAGYQARFWVRIRRAPGSRMLSRALLHTPRAYGMAAAKARG